MLSLRTSSRAFGCSLRRFKSAEAAGSSSSSSQRLAPAQAGTLLDIGIRDIFDSDHDMFREMTRNFFETEVKPFHGEWEKAGEVPRELWTKAGEMGLLANMVPEEVRKERGDMRWTSSCALAQFLIPLARLRSTVASERTVNTPPSSGRNRGELGRYKPSKTTSSDRLTWRCSPSRARSSYSGCTGPGFAMHSDIVAPYITNYGTEEQKVSLLLCVVC